jgi:hypothetical protein
MLNYCKIIILLWIAAIPAYSQDFITTDIDNFWAAYDKITTTKDSAQQHNYLKTLFIDKASPGQMAMVTARRYTVAEYINAINSYPKFWESLRLNTYKAKGFAAEIKRGAAKLKKIYSGLKPASVYFTVGALRSPGTTLDGMVLIGSELALGDANTYTTEFTGRFSGLQGFFEGSPITNIVFLNVHEYVHAQQKTTIGNNVLAQCTLEGVAEFVAEKAMAITSTTPAIHFGPKNDARIKEAFSKEMFNPNSQYNWLYNGIDNDFMMRDLGYYVGYAICKNYYDKAKDKAAAIKDMIELDYNDETALMAFVDKSQYFARPVKEYKEAFETSRPEVIAITPFANGSTNVMSGTTQIKVSFSAAMDTRFRNFDFGPLGEGHSLRVQKFMGFSEDGTSLTFETELMPGKQYQLMIGHGFRTPDGAALKPYLIDFKTAEK